MVQDTLNHLNLTTAKIQPKCIKPNSMGLALLIKFQIIPCEFSSKLDVFPPKPYLKNQDKNKELKFLKHDFYNLN